MQRQCILGVSIISAVPSPVIFLVLFLCLPREPSPGTSVKFGCLITSSGATMDRETHLVLGRQLIELGVLRSQRGFGGCQSGWFLHSKKMESIVA